MRQVPLSLAGVEEEAIPIDYAVLGFQEFVVQVEDQ